jgi:hypothetical protein
MQAPDQLLYFGDLDVRGLEIAAAASTTAESLGLTPVRPSVDVYMLLLTHGRPSRALKRAPTADRVADAVAWLPPRVRTPVTELLVTGHRMAQEAVGMDVLADWVVPHQLH